MYLRKSLQYNFFLATAAVVVISSVTSCAKRKFNANSNLRSENTTAGNRCTIGKEYSFILESLKGDTSFVQSKLFPAIDNNTGKEVKAHPTNPSPKENIELRLCLNEESSTIASILDIGFYAKELKGKISYNSKWQVKNLDKAIFQDYTGFELIAPSENTEGASEEMATEASAIRLKGITSGPIPFISAGIPTVAQQDPFKLSNQYALATVFVGNFINDTIPLNGKCRVYENYTEQAFTLGTATFTTQVCEMDNVIQDSSEHRIINAHIVDNNPLLNGKNIDITLDETAAASAFTTNSGHHNAALWGFSLKLPEVHYVVADSSFGDAASPSFENLPVDALYTAYSFACFTGGSFYRIKYGNNPWSNVERAPFKSMRESQIPRNAFGDGLINKNTEIKIWPTGLTYDDMQENMDEFNTIKVGCKVSANTKIKYKDSCKSTYSDGKNQNPSESFVIFLEEPLPQCPQVGKSFTIRARDFNTNGKIDISNID